MLYRGEDAKYDLTHACVNVTALVVMTDSPLGRQLGVLQRLFNVVPRLSVCRAVVSRRVVGKLHKHFDACRVTLYVRMHTRVNDIPDQFKRSLSW